MSTNQKKLGDNLFENKENKKKPMLSNVGFRLVVSTSCCLVFTNNCLRLRNIIEK